MAGVTAGIARACAAALVAEVLLVIGQPSAHPLIFAGQVAASALLAGVLAAGVRHLRGRPGRNPEGNPERDGGTPS
jgi:hypothetical protein